MIKKVAKLLLTLNLILMTVGVSSAYASYIESNNEIKVYGETGRDLRWVASQINNSSIIRFDGDICYMNASMRLYASPGFYINDSTVSELRINNTKNNTGQPRSATGLYSGKYYIENVTICSWNNNLNRPQYLKELQVTMSTDGGYIQNCLLEGLSGIGISKTTTDIHNVTIYNCSLGLNVNYVQSAKFYDIKATDLDGCGLIYNNCDDLEIYNCEVTNAGDYLSPATGQYGLVLSGNVTNSSVHDIFLNGSGHSTLGVSCNGGILSNNITVYNITIKNTGHNGLDIHGATNVSVWNMSIFDPIDSPYSTNSILITYGNISERMYTRDIYLRDIYTEGLRINPPAGRAGIGCYITNSKNITIENYTSVNDGSGVSSLTSDNITVRNLTVYNNMLGCSFGLMPGYPYLYVNDSKIFDSNLYDTTTLSLNVPKTRNTKIFNVLYKPSMSSFGDKYTGEDGEGTVFYYGDFIVKDESNSSLSGTISFSDANHSYVGTDATGTNKSSFTFSERTPLPSDRTNSIAIPSFYKSTTAERQYSTTANISTSLGNISLNNITPDSSWYRRDPNIPTYTITAIIPDNSTGPHITGFAPAKENPFNSGEKKNFRVWTDEPLTSMEWLVNGSSVLKGALNYTWNVTDRNTTIEFIGSNANGTVNHVWPLGESSNEPSVPDDNPTQEIQFSPADSEITLNVSEKTIFSVSPDIFTTKEWYINGCLIQNNTASMTRCWSTAGIFDVTFKGTGNGETVSHTWTVNVVEEQKNQNESIIKVDPEYQIIEPKKPFNLSIKIEPETSITGTQLDFAFNSPMASVVNVTEGDLLKQSGAYTIFSSGTINNSAGTVKNIYGFILGTSNVSSPGTMATVNLSAGNNTGMAKFSLTNVIISDANSKSVPYTVTNATVLIDTAPVITPIGSKSVNEKSTLAFKVSARDADGDRLILSASGVPQGAVFNTTSGNFTWTPERGQAGIYTITFKVSDGYLTDSQSVTVTVNKLNNPPAISSFEPLNGSSFSEGERIGISVNASDAEGQALNYSIRIDGIEYSTGKEYVWETDYSSSGNHTIEVVVSDGIDEAKAQRTVFINECHPRWDVNEDGVVNILDITMVSQTYGTTVNKPYPRHDVNQDGVVNILDLTLVGNHFGEYVN